MIPKLFSARNTEPAPVHHQLNVLKLPVAGVKVDDESALTYSAFWCCVKIISETIAYLPWHVFRHGNKSQHESGHWLDDTLYRRPNEEMSSFTFKRLLVSKLLSHGNGHCEIERNRLGRIVNLWPISNNDLVEYDRDNRGRLVYIISSGSGGTSITLPARDIYHVRGPSPDGIVGYSVVRQARESIGLGLAAESFGASFFGGGGIPGMIIKDSNTAQKTKMSTEGVKNLLKKWNRRLKTRNASMVEYLDAGLDVDVVGMPLADAQFLETRKFQISEMCRWFRLPPHKLADLERSTHNNIESQNIEFVTDAILPNSKCLESEGDFRLLGEEGKNYYTKLNVMGILRGDSAARREYYKALAGMGVLTIDDIRDREDLDLIGGDIGNLRLVPTNMTTPERMINGDIKQTATLNALFEETAKRFCKMELKRVAKYRAATSDEDIVKYHAGFAQACCDGFYRLTTLFFEMRGIDCDTSEALKAFFSRWCANAVDDIKKALVSDAMPILVSSWEASRDSKLSRDLLIHLSELK